MEDGDEVSGFVLSRIFSENDELIFLVKLALKRNIFVVVEMSLLEQFEIGQNNCCCKL